MTAAKPPSQPSGEGSETAENVTYHPAPEAASVARRTTVKVTLADAPTDVLCWLAQRPGQAFVPAEIARAVAPPDADDPFLTTLDALHLLRDGLYVTERMNCWEATVEGRAAVVEAMTKAGEQP